MMLITGATGNIGRHLVRRLAADGRTFSVASRKPIEDLPTGVVGVVADFTQPDTLGPMLEGIEDLFVLVHVHGGNVEAANLGRAIAASKVRRVVMLSSASVERVVAGDLIGDGHREAEAMIAEAGRPVVFVRPGTLMFNAFAWAPQIRQGDEIRGVDNAPAAIMDEADVAIAVAALLADDRKPTNGSYLLTGPEALSAADQVHIMSASLGRALKFLPLSVEDAEASVIASMSGRGDAKAVIDNVKGPNVVWAKPNGVFEALTGRKPQTFHKWIDAHRDAFQAPPADADETPSAE